MASGEGIGQRARQDVVGARRRMMDLQYSTLESSGSSNKRCRSEGRNTATREVLYIGRSAALYFRKKSFISKIKRRK